MNLDQTRSPASEAVLMSDLLVFQEITQNFLEIIAIWNTNSLIIVLCIYNEYQNYIVRVVPRICSSISVVVLSWIWNYFWRRKFKRISTRRIKKINHFSILSQITVKITRTLIWWKISMSFFLENQIFNVIWVAQT